MKKEIVIVLLLLAVLSVFVYAATDVDFADETSGAAVDSGVVTTPTGEVDTSADYAGETEKKVEPIKIDSKKIDENLGRVFNKQVNLPDDLQKFMSFWFQINNRITYQQFAVYICVWFMVLLIIESVLSIMPFAFNEGFRKWAAAIIITLLTSMSGGINFVASMIFDASTFFGLWEKIWAPLRYIAIFVAIAIIIFFFMLTKYITRTIKESQDLASAESAGVRIGMFGRFMQGFWDAFK